MDYILMHKNIAVADLLIDEMVAAIVKVGNVYHPEHIPVGVTIKGGRPDRKAMNDWWIGRSIPASRSGLREALNILHLSSPQFLLTKCFGLSLSDQYWVRPANKQLEWKDINFFENKFSEDVGNAFFGRMPNGDNIDLLSPDNTSDGWLKKKWVSADGK
ncbi:MAG TPA: excisionase, partial [Clostridiales bacterium]|nr:excisionase [Clostridiales bacterium]